ncbi:MAG: sigma-70 family RNA polymerase sigma factor [Leptospira sp.]|nr:sigma-70 family RNA polymerase sigma factor [Leptospira sp.]
MRDTNQFLILKSYLFSIAYRITGSYQDAEDILQETYLRYMKDTNIDIKNLKSYLGKTTARLAFDLLKKASRKKETYIGPYLPEPIPETHESHSENKVHFALLVVLESLNPIERAVFILRELFSYEYEWIAEVVNKSPSNIRQIFKRAKISIEKREKKFAPDPSDKTKIINEFLFACYTKDTTKLTNILREDAIAYSDGGGKVHAARIPISGALRLVNFLIKTTANAKKDIEVYFTQANGELSIIGYKNKSPVFFQYLEMEKDKVFHVYNILNPEKLKGFQNFDQLEKEGLVQKVKKRNFLFLFFIHFIKLPLRLFNIQKSSLSM